MFARTCLRAVSKSAVKSASPVLSRASPVLSRSFATLVPQTPNNVGHVEDSEARYGYQSTDNCFEENQLDASQMADPTNRTFVYLMQGTAAFMYASVGRVAVMQFVSFLSASADVMAVSTIEVDISGVTEGNATTVKWRGKPVFIRHRTAKEIAQAEADDNTSLRDQQTDSERFSDRKQWAVLIGVCTHLGCVPINAAGDYGGWFCPCHGSHYDTSGRIRKGPAPLNLEVPAYKFLTDTKILLG